jgi:hypothetical protein
MIDKNDLFLTFLPSRSFTWPSMIGDCSPILSPDHFVPAITFHNDRLAQRSLSPVITLPSDQVSITSLNLMTVGKTHFNVHSAL